MNNNNKVCEFCDNTKCEDFTFFIDIYTEDQGEACCLCHTYKIRAHYCDKCLKILRNQRWKHKIRKIIRRVTNATA